MDRIEYVLSTGSFMPHGMCYLWQPGVLGLHVIADSLITLAYFSIPVTLLYFVRKRGDLQFSWIFVCFAVFIIACGTTHLMEILTIWHPVYWISGGIKALTALASVPTAILLVKLVPVALRVPSPAALQKANLELEREVTERKRAESEVRRINAELEAQQTVMQQEHLRALSQMASGIAHDLNNALAPAALYVESILERDTSLSDHARDYLVAIQRAVDDVARTVARMKESYHQREPKLAHTCVDLNRILRQVVDLTRERWSDMAVSVQTDLAVDLPPMQGAAGEIRDALTNLITNAADAMPKGGTLTLRTRALESNRVSVEVIDTGIGMDETTRACCLEPFFTTKGERGTGLGLAMVYGMAQRHGGEIQIESELGRGTLIRLTFPAREGRVSLQPRSSGEMGRHA
jgi:signal transduction histidine kinase